MANQNHIAKELKRKYIKKIASYESQMKQMQDSDFALRTEDFRRRFQELPRTGNPEKDRKTEEKFLTKILPEAFAMVREAGVRTTGKRLFDVQMIAGCSLHFGYITQQLTGQGKTLTATLPAYLNAISGRGVHVVTVNDYLAKVGEETLRPLYELLGLTTAVIFEGDLPDQRREAYQKDVCYITNSELGFDYLRDNMVFDEKQKVQRPFNYCIIDEVDSILIDEARTPLIISRPSDKPTDLYRAIDMFVKLLKPKDYEVDKKLGVVTLTESGIEKAERILSLKNYADTENNMIRHHISQALKANFDMQRDKEYIVKDGQIVIIDEFTGRIADGRRFSKGLHQAIEAKEGLEIKEESITLATITYQNFFKLYPKFAGMTGTADTEKREFKETYEKKVCVVPPEQKVIRKDHQDIVFFTETAKNKAIIADIKENYEKGRPVLVGTPSIDKSENLSKLLDKEGIPHQVLNAKYHEIEAQIVAKAGQKYAVTIATNMAGRGTDILLGDGVKELGGLKVIGTERAENRRVDNQLMGRAGRQGDPGESQFYVSFEDNLMYYASEVSKTKIENVNQTDDNPVQSHFLSSIIRKCQDNRTNQNFDARHNTLKYDEIVNHQRMLIYQKRDEALKNQHCEEIILSSISSIVEHNYEKLNRNMEDVRTKLRKDLLLKTRLKGETKEELIEELTDIFDQNPFIEDAKDETTIALKEAYLRKVILSIMDDYWIQHLNHIDDLRQDVKLLGYRGEDPIHAFTNGANLLFQDMSNQVRLNVLISVLHYTKKKEG